MRGESERMREQSGHATKATPRSANRLRSMATIPENVHLSDLLVDTCASAVFVVLCCPFARAFSWRLSFGQNPGIHKIGRIAAKSRFCLLPRFETFVPRTGVALDLQLALRPTIINAGRHPFPYDVIFLFAFCHSKIIQEQ